MTNPFRSVLQWFRSAHRVEPEQLEEALRQMLAHPQTRKLIFKDWLEVFPIQGGVDCPTPAGNVGPGTFGSVCGGGNYGIGVDPPLVTFPRTGRPSHSPF